MSEPCHINVKNFQWLSDCESGMNRLTVVNNTVVQSYEAVILQFAVIFMRRQCRSICQTETCNWKRLTRKSLAGSAEQSKTLDNIPASCLKINNPGLDGECTWDRPHTVVIFSPSTPPHTPRSSLPPHYARNPKLNSVSSDKTPSMSLCSFQFFVSQSFPSHLLLSSASWVAEHQWRILGNSCKMIHHLAFTTCMHFCACKYVRERSKERGGGEGVQICFNFSIGS